MENMQFWDRLAKLPTSAMKAIKGGRLNGKSDINPQARYRAMTELFGPCGVGWKYTVDRLWIEPGVEGNVFVFAQVTIWIKADGQWSEPIPGVGGNKLIEKESKGLYCNDEAYKMAVTDALGTAMKMLGVGAEVYLGNFDGAKYVNHGGDQPAYQPPPPSANSLGNGPKPLAPAPSPAPPAAPSPTSSPKTWGSMSANEQLDNICSYIDSTVKMPTDQAEAALKADRFANRSQDLFKRLDAGGQARLTEKMSEADALIRQERAASGQ
jgi:hypothetical protein